MTASAHVAPDLVASVARGQGVTLAPGVVAALVQFGDLFLRWNARINLGGQIGPRELVERHFADAFAAARFVSPETAVIDVGSGGGLPALPLALISPRARFELWEPTGKKVAFLRTAVRELELGGRVLVHAGRVEPGLSAGGGRSFELATSRATFAPLDWLALGRSLISPDGRVLVFATDDELPTLEVPLLTHQYDRNRRLLLFGPR